MRVAIYNSMYSLNGKSFWSSIVGHWAVHYQCSVKEIWKRTDINRTIEILKKSNADIVGICEILEGQEEELKKKLRAIGYGYIFFGNGHKTKFNRLRIKVVVASKIKCTKKEINGFPTKNELGGGGGVICCYFPTSKLNVLCVHFAILQNKELYLKQINFLQNHIKRLKERIVLLGDFNNDHNKIKDYFDDLKLASDGNKTCSLTPIFRIIHFKDDDHIFVRNLEIKHTACLEGFSDHKLLYADLM